MQTGSCRFGRAAKERGFTYLMLLLALAIGAAGLAALGTQWRTTVQRDRELELLFRGGEIAAAIARYRAAVANQPEWPRSVEDLLEDRRGGQVRRHLRRYYTDPFTGKTDWVLTRTEDGGFRGVRSRSEAPALITRGFVPGTATALASSLEAGAAAHSEAPVARPTVAQHYFGSSASGVPWPVTGVQP